jgi:tetratricopeptide (TPR) repeat protein
MDIYQQAIKLNPNYSEAHYNLGSLYRMKGKPEEAITCFKKAIQINPDYAEAYAGLGVAEYALRDYQRAKSNLQKAKELFQKSGDKESLQLVQDYLKIIP